MANAHLVWVDCEMTGLDLTRDALVELAVLVTDDQLNVLGEGVDVVIRPPDEALEQMVPFVRDMHTTSGLIDVLQHGITVDEAQQLALDYIRQFEPEPRKAPMAGNTIATDRNFIARDMAELDAHLHYRMVDVSSIKELVRRWYPRTYYQAPAKTGGHRALGDIRDSIDELRYYRAAVFVPPPGPDTDAARALAAALAAPEPDGEGSSPSAAEGQTGDAVAPPAAG
jgi:oligoribonuclease